MPHYDFGLTIGFDDRRHDSKRRAEPPWRTWQKSPIWKSIKRHRLAKEPCCRHCAMEGRTVVASYVDHITPHFGQWLSFIKYESTQSLCSHHHHALKKQQDRRGGYN
jgi:5-methylcytosine-specific restriction enzyme A